MSAVQQGTAAWLALRSGRVTASRIADLIARTKTGWSASRESYLKELMVERLTGKPHSTIPTPAMRWGQECEPWAKAAYAFYADREVESLGFVNHPSIGMSGASPDALVGEEGLLEVKCPTTAVHLETIAEGGIPAKHLVQIQWQLACTERAWCDFVSFDPRLPHELSFVAHRVERDASRIAELEQEVIAFLAELEDRIDGLPRLAQREAPACYA